MLGGVISYPVPPYANVPIEPEYYQPSRFEISAISLGQNTTVTTSVDHNYVVGQQIRLLIPSIYGSYQLNNLQGLVIEVPISTSVLVNIDSTTATAFVTSPYVATITNISILDSSHALVTANNSFHLGNPVRFKDVSGTSEINLLVAPITAVSPSDFTVSLNTTSFSPYTSGGVASLFIFPQSTAQIIAIGDVNSGVTNPNGRVSTTTNIPGSFINISPF